MVMLILRWLLTAVLAFGLGILVSKVKLPAILGWLIGGMILGPYAIGLLPQVLIDAEWYDILMNGLECAVGIMIGTELVWSKIKKYGKALLVTTLWQSLGTFALVSLCFGIIFFITGIPMYLAFVFGGIALATAPAPALSIVKEFHTEGPVTRTLIPMAALDDIVGVVVFFTVISVVAGHVSGGAISLIYVPVMILLPLVIGAAVGIPAGFILKRVSGKNMTNLVLIIGIVITTIIGELCNTYLMPSPLLNFMLMGMAFSAAFSNIVSVERVKDITIGFNRILGIAMLLVIINLGAPLDYHKILGAGVYTLIYIVARACGKYFGARIGASRSGMETTVQKYLGLTLLPHSGVSLVFTGIATSMLSGAEPELAAILSGTIAAAAIINEIIAVVMAKKGFELAGEMQK